MRGLPSTMSVFLRRSMTALRTICQVKGEALSASEEGKKRERHGTHAETSESELLSSVILERIGDLGFELGVVVERVDDLTEKLEEGIEVHDAVLDGSTGCRKQWIRRESSVRETVKER